MNFIFISNLNQLLSTQKKKKITNKGMKNVCVFPNFYLAFKFIHVLRKCFKYFHNLYSYENKYKRTTTKKKQELRNKSIVKIILAPFW